MNNGRICISICAATADELVGQLRRAEPLADVVEVRFDCLAAEQLSPAINALKHATPTKPLIATYRSPEQGGNRQLTREERLEFWRRLDGGFAFADIEQDVRSGADFKHEIIASHHGFDGVRADLDGIYEGLSRSDPTVVKVAATAHDVCDAIPIWKLLERATDDGREIIPIAMGEAGKWTRILGLAHGAFLTYASLDRGKETADGQITADDLINVYRAKELDRETGVYGVIGDPVSSSLSPFMHNAGFAKSGLNAVFLPLQVKGLDAFMRRMVLPATREVELNFAGFSVTMPHKQAIQKYLTDIDPAAQKIGAVNTVKIDGDKQTGYNTDADGFIAPLKQRIPDLKSAHVAVLGAGGAARAVVHALQQEHAEVTVFARDPKRARPLADGFKAPISDLATIAHRSSTFDIIINTTPLGMRGPNETKTPLTANHLLGIKFVYDLVTHRDETPLLREAREAGVEAIGGVEMLIAQGLKQFEIWTGLEAPANVMRAAVLDRLK
ncbi:MAG TPA: shikimate dehydrogenase [Pyrinomonadaceae bacterium]